jgi:hypothetical protein
MMRPRCRGEPADDRELKRLIGSDPLRNADRPQFLVFVDETEKLGGKVIAAANVKTE